MFYCIYYRTGYNYYIKPIRQEEQKMNTIQELEQKMNRLIVEAEQLEEFNRPVQAEAKMREARAIWDRIAELARKGY